MHVFCHAQAIELRMVQFVKQIHKDTMQEAYEIRVQIIKLFKIF